MPSSRTRLLMVGAGHAALEALRRLGRTPLSGVELTLVSPATRHHYSGMVPGFLAGMYEEEELAFELPVLVERARGQLVLGQAVALDAGKRRVRLAGAPKLAPLDEDGDLGTLAGSPEQAAMGEVWDRVALPGNPELAALDEDRDPGALAGSPEQPATYGVKRLVRHAGDEEQAAYDIAVFAVGSTTSGSERPEIAAHAWPAKPIARLVALRGALRELARRPDATTAVVVGGGAAGVEVALAMRAVFAHSGARHRVELVEAGAEILRGYPALLRRRALAVLARHDVAVRTGTPVTAVAAGEVALANGGRLASALTVWLTGAVAWPVFKDSGLPLDERDFLLVDDALRALGDPRVLAAGDCATLASHPHTPKAGVYAVRQGPVLWRSLCAAAAAREQTIPRYRPQRTFLSILNTSDGKALLSYRGFVSYSRWALRLKDRIDRRFVARYR
jgi:NADH dehydrogenase FAD-containing subunit